MRRFFKRLLGLDGVNSVAEPEAQPEEEEKDEVLEECKAVCDRLDKAEEDRSIASVILQKKLIETTTTRRRRAKSNPSVATDGG